MMGFLVSAFAVQTSLVYTDETPLSTPPLSELALQGRDLWHQHNCMTCHQVYGFGGFLGPDLTNAAPRLNRARLDEILTVGYGQMPAFHFAPEQIDAIEAYLGELDQTGVGQARHVVPFDPGKTATALDRYATANPMSAGAATARETFDTRCASCHQLFQATPLGPFVAPDLTDVRARLSEDEIRTTFSEGRPTKGMPPTGFSAQQADDMLDLLTWLNDHRDALRRELGIDGQSRGWPWFEFQ